MRKEKGGKRGRKKMDEREKESEVEDRSEVITEEGTERREEEEIEEGPAIGEAVTEEEKRGVKKIRSAILQPREPGCEPLLQTVRKFPLYNLSSSTLNCITRNIDVSTTGPEERLSGQKYLKNSSYSPLM